MVAGSPPNALDTTLRQLLDTIRTVNQTLSAQLASVATVSTAAASTTAAGASTTTAAPGTGSTVPPPPPGLPLGYVPLGTVANPAPSCQAILARAAAFPGAPTPPDGIYYLQPAVRAFIGCVAGIHM